MKRILLVILLLFILTGCASQKEADVSDLTDALLARATFDETPEELSRDVLGWRYGIEEDVEARVFVSSATAEELCVMKAADEESAKAVLELLTTHISEQKDAYAHYAPEEVTRLEHAALRREGRVVVLLVSADARPEDLIGSEM